MQASFDHPHWYMTHQVCLWVALALGHEGHFIQNSNSAIFPHEIFVRILDSSQIWEERVHETRIITTEGLTTCLDPGRGWTITREGWNFLKKQECWKGHEQALIATIRKETKQTEELEDAGSRSQTWASLREREKTRGKNSENAFLLRVASVAKRKCDL